MPPEAPATTVFDLLSVLEQVALELKLHNLYSNAGLGERVVTNQP